APRSIQRHWRRSGRNSPQTATEASWRYPARPEVATLLAMSTAEQLPLAEVKNRLSDVVDRVEREHDRVGITKHGRPAAVVLSVDDLESLEESLEILSDATLVAEIREAELERSEGRTEKLSKDQILARVRTR